MGGVLLNAIILVLLYHNNIHWPGFALFQITQSTIFQFWTPDFLRGYATGIPNSPLWTIGVMVQCYFALWFCYRFLHNKGKRRWILTITAFVIFNLGRPVIEPYIPHVLYRLIWNAFPTHLWMFLIGGFVWEYFNSLISILKKGWPISLILAIAVNYFQIDIGNYPLLKSVFLLCFSVGFGYSFPALKLRYDFSYGLYLYHMIVINVMVFFDVSNSIQYIILAYVLSLLLSIISYFVNNILRSRNE